MVEDIIVYRRRATADNSLKRHACKHDSSLKRNPEKKQRSNELDECTRKTSDSMLGVQKLGVVNVKGDLKQKQGIKTHNDQLSFDMKDDQREIVAYLDFEVLQSDLVDVDLSVEASHRGEKVPFVCLTSESYGKPILGYPLEIGEMADGSETSLVLSKESVARKIFGDKRSRVHQLVWRTSKRTPVCYVTNSPSSHVSKKVQATKASENVEEKMKNTKQFNRGKTASSQTCVPVEVIFRKISSGITYLA